MILVLNAVVERAAFHNDFRLHILDCVCHYDGRNTWYPRPNQEFRFAVNGDCDGLRIQNFPRSHNGVALKMAVSAFVRRTRGTLGNIYSIGDHDPLGWVLFSRFPAISLCTEVMAISLPVDRVEPPVNGVL